MRRVDIVFTNGGTKPARWKGPGYLPHCVRTKACQCASVVRVNSNGGAHIEAPGCRLVKVPTVDRHLQVRLECVTHHNVGGPLPLDALLAGQAIDPSVLPDSHNTVEWQQLQAKRA